MKARPHILHAFSSFAAAGPQVRTVEIINATGAAMRHSIMSMDGDYGAAGRIRPGVEVRLIDAPGKRSSLTYPLVLASAIRKTSPDLLITYNWGAIESAMGVRLMGSPPVIHTEDGFGPEEAVKLKLRRVWTRRLLLPRVYATVVPSRTLLKIALERYKLKPEKVRYIPNGVDLARFRPGRNDELRSAWGAGPGTAVFGFVGHIRYEKNLPLLLRAFKGAALHDARLVLVGAGECEAEIRLLAQELGLGQTIVFAGSIEDTVPYYQAFDVFVLSSATEQMPVSLLEAMACGLSGLCTDVGDVSELLGTRHGPAVVGAGDEAAYVDAIRALAADGASRSRIGAQNRDRCLTRYSLDGMVRQYQDLYLSAIRA
jgi:glycosyltransferase involved in cell wall biosynthesis